jgi:hypothetical protein
MNKRRYLRKLPFALVLAIAGCGGGGGSEPQPVLSEPSAPPGANDVVVIGNSITRHHPLAAIGWDGDWGMAASAADKDFAHVAAEALGRPLSAYNLSALERGQPDTIPQISPTNVLVVELGDNATDVEGFTVRYKAMLDGYAPLKLACVSTWWEKPAIDAMIKQQCESHGGTYVYIGNILPSRQDDVGRYANIDVDNHPHDWSMAVIGARVAAALQ